MTCLKITVSYSLKIYIRDQKETIPNTLNVKSFPNLLEPYMSWGSMSCIPQFENGQVLENQLSCCLEM